MLCERPVLKLAQCLQCITAHGAIIVLQPGNGGAGTPCEHPRLKLAQLVPRTAGGKL